jgi:hypothetical protein
MKPARNFILYFVGGLAVTWLTYQALCIFMGVPS